MNLYTGYKKWLRSFMLGFILIGFLNQLSFAAPAPGDTEEQSRRARQEEQERHERQQKQDVFLETKVVIDKDETLPEETSMFSIQRVELTGEKTAQFPWLSHKAAKYNGRKIGQQGINVIVKRLNNELINKGYITSRVLVPEQDVSQGKLTLVLVAGMIGDIRFEGSAERADWQSAFPTRPGDILNLKDLEQGLEQLKRIPSQDVDFKLVPGKQVGQSDVVISIKRTKPWKLAFSLDDSGSEATGRLQQSATFVFDNVIGINDLFNVSLNQDAAGHRSQYGTNGSSMYWSFPQGYWTYSLSHSNHDYKQTLTSSGNTLVYTGNSDNVEVKAEKLIYRDKTSKTSVHFSLLQNQSYSYIDDIEILVQRKNTSAMEVGLSQRRYIDKDTWDYLLSYRHGMPWFGAQSEGGLPGNATTRYGMWIGEIDWTKPGSFLGREARYNSTLRGQYTNSTLYSADCFSIGNRYTVRGFDGEQTLTGERGFYWRNQVSVPLDNKVMEVYGAVDYGQVSGPSAASLVGHQLIGAALGIRGTIKQTNFDVFVGWPLKEPANVRSGNPSYGFQFNWQM